MCFEWKKQILTIQYLNRISSVFSYVRIYPNSLCMIMCFTVFHYYYFLLIIVKRNLLYHVEKKIIWNIMKTLPVIFFSQINVSRFISRKIWYNPSLGCISSLYAKSLTLLLLFALLLSLPHLYRTIHHLYRQFFHFKH